MRKVKNMQLMGYLWRYPRHYLWDGTKCLSFADPGQLFLSVGVFECWYSCRDRTTCTNFDHFVQSTNMLTKWTRSW